VGLVEQALVSKLRELASKAQPGRLPAPVVTNAPQLGGEQRIDELRALASMRGVDIVDLEACRETREAYEWCLALLDPNRPPPPYPFPEKLHNLLLKLVGEGKIEPGRLRLLGLGKRLVEIVARRVERALSEVARSPIPSRRELVDEFAKIREIYAKASRVVQPEVLEEAVIMSVRKAIPAPSRDVEHAIIEMFKGVGTPVEAAEKVIASLAPKVEAPREEREVAERAKRLEAPKVEVVQARAQAPRAE
jgi:hypothetical protein